MPTQKAIDEMREKGGLTDHWDFCCYQFRKWDSAFVSIYSKRMCVHGFVACDVLLTSDANDSYSVSYDNNLYYVDEQTKVCDNLVRRISGSLSMQISDMHYDYNRNLWIIGKNVIQGQCIYDSKRHTYAFFSNNTIIVRNIKDTLRSP